jgi:hypothetical protein
LLVDKKLIARTIVAIAIIANARIIHPIVEGVK